MEAVVYVALSAALLALPWELLHDGRSYLFEGGQPVRVTETTSQSGQLRAPQRPGWSTADVHRTVLITFAAEPGPWTPLLTEAVFPSLHSRGAPGSP
jgi:hypothetical protein